MAGRFLELRNRTEIVEGRHENQRAAGSAGNHADRIWRIVDVDVAEADVAHDAADASARACSCPDGDTMLPSVMSVSDVHGADRVSISSAAFVRWRQRARARPALTPAPAPAARPRLKSRSPRSIFRSWRKKIPYQLTNGLQRAGPGPVSLPAWRHSDDRCSSTGCSTRTARISITAPSARPRVAFCRNSRRCATRWSVSRRASCCASWAGTCRCRGGRRPGCAKRAIRSRRSSAARPDDLVFVPNVTTGTERRPAVAAARAAATRSSSPIWPTARSRTRRRPSASEAAPRFGPCASSIPSTIRATSSKRSSRRSRRARSSRSSIT